VENVMFSFWKSKRKPSLTAATDILPRSIELSDDVLVRFILKILSSQNLTVSALFLVAYENSRVYYSVFLDSVQSAKTEQYAPSFDGMVDWLISLYSRHMGTSTEDEFARRRTFYLYLAILLKIAHTRAKANPSLWELIVDVWLRLLEGSRVLQTTLLEKTSLWTADEITYFQHIKSSDDGQNYCLSLMVPSEIRYHPKISQWLVRDLPENVRAQIQKSDELFREILGQDD